MESPRLVMSFAVAYMYNDTEPRVGWSGSDNNPSVQIFQRVLNPTDLQFSVTSSEGEVMQWPQCTNVEVYIKTIVKTIFQPLSPALSMSQ